MPNTPKNFSVNKSRILIQGSTQDIQVPFDKVELSNGESILMYTVEGNATDVRNMPKLRDNWHAKVACGEKFKVKKIDAADVRCIVEHPVNMLDVIGLQGSFQLRSRLSLPMTLKTPLLSWCSGNPANINHPEVEPMIIGKDFAVKARQYRRSSLSLTFDEEITNTSVLRYGADTVMDPHRY